MRLPIIAAAIVLIAACGGRTAKEDLVPAPVTIAETNDDERLAHMPKGTKHYEERTESGKLRARGFLCDEKPIGAWSYAYENGQKRCEGTYLYGGMETGRWAYWWPNGRTHAEGDYAKGHEHGTWKYWHDNGVLAAEGAYVHGKRVGAWRSWHENGAAESEGAFRDDARIGHWYYGDSEGEDAGRVTYAPDAR